MYIIMAIELTLIVVVYTEVFAIFAAEMAAHFNKPLWEDYERVLLR
jgi:hypothetical protein